MRLCDSYVFKRGGIRGTWRDSVAHTQLDHKRIERVSNIIALTGISFRSPDERNDVKTKRREGSRRAVTRLSSEALNDLKELHTARAYDS